MQLDEDFDDVGLASGVSEGALAGSLSGCLDGAGRPFHLVDRRSAEAWLIIAALRHATVSMSFRPSCRPFGEAENMIIPWTEKISWAYGYIENIDFSNARLAPTVSGDEARSGNE